MLRSPRSLQQQIESLVVGAEEPPPLEHSSGRRLDFRRVEDDWETVLMDRDFYSSARVVFCDSAILESGKLEMNC